MRLSALLLAAPLVGALLLATAGCTGGGDGPDDRTADPRPAPPAPFAAATPAPAGWELAQCADLRSRRNSGLATRFGVPPGFTATERDDTSCGYASGGVRELYVASAPPETLRAVKRRDIDPFVGEHGDDEISDAVLSVDVPVFGAHRGERLAYYCYCDGQDLDYVVLQAAGVRLQWVTAHGRADHAADLAVVTGSLGLVRSRASRCVERGRVAVYEPPIPQTESIDHGDRRCHLYLQPGRESLQRYAEVVPAPTRTLESLARGLRRHPRSVHGVRLERGAGRLDGRRADRLTWSLTRERPSVNGEPAGTWRMVTWATPDLQVTWGARPGRWQQEAAVVRRFVDSVRLLPR